MSKEIFVHIDLEGKPCLAGRLWLHTGRDHESATFEYDMGWRTGAGRFALEPALELREGTFHTERALFGAIGDSAPDRWGRVLMDRREARQAALQGRTPRSLRESDYLLMVNDIARQGALRFSEKPDGPFLASNTADPVPPLVQLGRLLGASNRILARAELEEDLRQLVGPGSSLGGARPKASVLDNDGTLLIAKFPSRLDEWDVELWEFISFRLAARAGLTVPEVRLEKIGGNNVLLLKRFDRRGTGVRVPFLSAMSMLGAVDGEHGSYLELADVLLEYGANPAQDLMELWRRMVFNIMISNVDDHLRNHGFLHDSYNGWHLSPVYDLEPTPVQVKPRILHTRIDFHDGTASLDSAYAVAEEFGLSPKKARKIAQEIGEATQSWNREATRFGASKEEIEFMRSAFEHRDLEQALK